MKVQYVLSSEIVESPRVLQMSAMFDVPIEKKATESWVVDFPIGDRDWNVGLVVGPSGSGKSSFVKHVWPDKIARDLEWDGKASVLDGFPGQLGVREVVGLLTRCGLSSPPAWMLPRQVLSVGEGFRADLARALAEGSDLCVVDEFSSVVDRQVAKAASHTVQRTVRERGSKFVAVSCHYDIIDWLQPDWVLDMRDRGFAWRHLQRRPAIQLDIYPAQRGAWGMFAKHHYMSASLHTAAHCYIAYVGETPVAFTAYRHFPHRHTKNIKIGHRLVVLPDWQGLGIGGRLDDWLGQKLYEEGFRYHNVVAHPALIRYYLGSPRWKSLDKGSKKLTTTSKNKTLRARALDPRYLGTRSFAYVPPKSVE